MADATSWCGRVICLLALAGGNLLAQVNPVFNQITGEVKWNNATPGAVLNFLNTHGFRRVEFYASENPVTHSPPLGSITLFDWPLANLLSPFDLNPYTITVHAGDAGGSGVSYDLSPRVTWHDANSANEYWFDRAASTLMLPPPAGPVTVNFSECAGLVRLEYYRMINSVLTPFVVNDSRLEAQLQPAAGLKSSAYPPPGLTEHTLIVQGGRSYNVAATVYEMLGSSPFLDQFRLTHTASFPATVPCEEIVTNQIILIPPPGSGSNDLGRIVGKVDMLTENEHWFYHSQTMMSAEAGPQGNYRLADVGALNQTTYLPCVSYPAVQKWLGTPTCNSAGPFELPNLLSSTALNENKPYQVHARMIFGLGRRFELFQSPKLDGQPAADSLVHNAKVPVAAGQTVDLTDMFVINPGWVVGDVYLCGSPNLTNSCLRYLNRGSDVWSGDGHQDADQDGVPDTMIYGDGRGWTGSTRVWALGNNSLGTGATKTAQGGLANAIFEGDFQSSGLDAGRFVGDYRLTLGGLKGETLSNGHYGETTRWDQGHLSLLFHNTPGRPGFDGNYTRCTVNLQNHAYQNVEIVPTTTVTNHHRYGGAQVTVTFHSTGDPFFDPAVTGNGSFNGVNFESHPANYAVEMAANGTPFDQNSAAYDGRIVMWLPEGEYDLNPTAKAVNGGSVSVVSLPSIHLVVTPCSEITVSDCIGITVTNVPDCATTNVVMIGGWVTNRCAEVTNIAYELNGVRTDLCNNCGNNPSFNFALNLQPCVNHLKVIARDALGNQASFTKNITFDLTPPVLSGCTNIVTNSVAGLGGNYVFYSVSALDNCDGAVPVVYSPPPGWLFPIGSTPVVCTAVDGCGNTNTCSFSVTVQSSSNCCDNCVAPYPICYTNVVQTGVNYLANNLCQGTNELPLAALTVPDGTQLDKWNVGTQSYEIAFFESSLGGWVDISFAPINWTIATGEGFVLHNPGAPFDLIICGCDPECPPPCLPLASGLALVGRYGVGPATWDDLSSCPPECGDQVAIWNGVALIAHDFYDGQWNPPLPLIGVGQSVFIQHLANTNCVPCTNNLVVNGSFESPVIAGNFDNGLTGVPGWSGANNGGNPVSLEFWRGSFGGMTAQDGQQHLEINAAIANESVSQVITNVCTNAVAKFCFWYAGRPGFGDNRFQVEVLGSGVAPASFNPPSFTTNTGWQQYCLEFIPVSPTLILKFTATSGGGIDGGAHIDNVSLTQCCSNTPCNDPLLVDCPTNKTVECGAAWTFDAPTVSSPCCGTNFTLTIAATWTNGFCPQTMQRIWEITDCHTNVATCTQTVSVVDTTPPVLTCPANKTVNCTNAWDFDPPTVFDACCSTNVTVVILSTVTNAGPPQTIMRTWQASDCCGNTATCSQVVTLTTGGTIKGRLFADLDSDCSQDPGDYPLSGWLVRANPGNHLGLTGAGGNYSINVPSGVYTLSVVTPFPSGFAQTCPVTPSYSVFVPECETVFRNFTFRPPPGTNCPNLWVNLEPRYPGPKLVHIRGPSTPCCGADFTYYIQYGNNGDMPAPGGTIQFLYPASPVLALVNIDLSQSPGVVAAPFTLNPAANCPPLFPSSGMLTFTIPALNPNDHGTIAMKVHLCCNITTPCTNQLSLLSQATILPLLPDDCNLADNVSTHAVKPCCSSDPNDCTVTPKGCGPEGFMHRDQPLTYLVQFQNEGGAPANLVVIQDILDDDLDLGTLEDLGGSHPYYLQKNGRKLLFIFPDINLAPQSLDEEASHGFVKFRIRPRADAPVGTQLTNSAAIYFDANDAVVTITTTNTITEDPLPVAAFAVTPLAGSAGMTNDFTYTGGTVGASHLWEFGPDATPSSSTLPNPTGVVFNQPGPHLVSLRTSLGDCAAEPAVRMITAGRPELSIARAQTSWLLSWPGDGYLLEESDHLTLTTNWHVVSPAPTTVEGWNLLESPHAAIGKFYRLKQTP